MKKSILVIALLAVIQLCSMEDRHLGESILKKIDSFPDFYEGNDQNGILKHLKKNIDYSNEKGALINAQNSPIVKLRSQLYTMHKVFQLDHNKSIKFTLEKYTSPGEVVIIFLKSPFCQINYYPQTYMATINHLPQIQDSCQRIVTAISNICDIFAKL